MSNGRYRTVFHTDLAPADAFHAASDEVRAWLRRKELDVAAFDAGFARVGAGKELLHTAGNGSDGTQTQRWQLREHQQNGHWLSSLVVHAPRRTNGTARTWFWLDVEFMRKDSDVEDPGQRAAVPYIVRQLLDAVEAYDSSMELRAAPRLVRPVDVDRLIDVLCDPDRRLPAIVASAHSRIEFEEWRQTIELVTKHVVGLAGIYILDPLATRALKAAIGDTHAVWGGAVRTYLPEVDPAVAADARRHRIMSAARIEVNPGRASRVLAGLPRELAADARLPGALVRLPRSGFGQLLRQEREGDEARPVAELDRLRGDLEAAGQLLDEAERVEARDRERLAELQDGLLDSTAELELAIDRIADLEAHNRYLRTRLEDAGQASAVPAAKALHVELPKSFSDVIERLSDLKLVEFTGDTDTTLDLENRAQNSVWAQHAWQALLALNAFAEAKCGGGFSGDFRAWCLQPRGDGAVIAAARVVPDESETVRNNARMRRTRTLPVPPEIDPSGKIFMGSHIRIGGGNTVA
ncbi:MAG TPA: hypothetical protein VF069_22895, partial [Streptosporangiaceae bacterium]